MAKHARKPDELLPLTPGMFHVLIALADGEKHGYAIIKEVARRTDGAIRLSAGTLYTFGCLVLPALIAKNLCREVRPMLWVAPLFACAAALAGFVLANGLDWPPAHATVAILAGALPLAWALRSLRSRREAAASR